jgi:uncharacterized damage-inducible protein DinB
MEDREKANVVADLELGRKALLDALSGVSEDAAKRVPSEGRWSILDCVEHLAVAEQGLFAQILAGQAAVAPTVNERREAGIRAGGADRSRPFQSPEMALPTGRFNTLAEALRRFAATRERTVEYVKGCEEDLRAKTMVHPRLGPVNCFETLLLIAVHTFRHTQQIEECKAAIG